jgi:pimeloyl-ACP methyl ester carboxylesterase
MSLTLDAGTLAARAAADGELRLAVRHWTGGIRLTIGDEDTGFTVTDGVIEPGVPAAGPDVISVAGPTEVWALLLAAVPPRLANGVVPFVTVGLLTLDADPVRYCQYLPALERTIELLRPPAAVPRPVADERGSLPRHDSPVGRYVHLQLDGVDHRIYYEHAGTGIPLLLQHTAGGHGVQWRHLFEVPEITEHFQLIAYDLPFHGKSVPPVGPRWWEEEYALRGEFLRQVPVALAAALGLERPVFMGCSVGGLLALDLALHHPDVFRAVISLEGSLFVGGDLDTRFGFWHPQVGNQTKARLMESLCAPVSPEAYVKEVSQVYSAGWPPAFFGDLHYYMADYDLRDRAGEIDTERCAVHILSGEYDWSGTAEMGAAAHDAISGSTHAVMAGVGHFPMQENPREFLRHVLPVLEEIRAAQ